MKKIKIELQVFETKDNKTFNQEFLFEVEDEDSLIMLTLDDYSYTFNGNGELILRTLPASLKTMEMTCEHILIGK